MESLVARRVAIPLRKAAAASWNHALGFFDERAGEWRNERNRSGRIQFRVRGVGTAEDIACEFQQRMLKTAASAEKRNVARARPFNGPERTLRVCVRTAWHAPDPVERIECFFLARL